MPPSDPPSTFDSDLLFNASPNAYLLLDTDLTIVKANDAVLQMTGREREEIVGQYVLEAFPGDPDDPDDSNVRQLKAAYERVLSTGKQQSIALLPYVIPREGTSPEERYWSATFTPILGDDGEVEFILHHPTDVTELYETKQKLRAAEDKQEENREDPASSRLSESSAPAGSARSPSEDDTASGVPSDGIPTEQVKEGVFSRAEAVQEALWESEEERGRLRRLFEQAPGFMVFQRGPDHVYELANDAYLDLIDRQDIIGKPIREVLPELEEQGFFDLLDQVYETGEPFVGREVEARVQKESGEGDKTVYVDFIYQPVTGPDGEVIGIFTQGHDVTEQKEAKDRLRHQKEQLQALNETLEERAQEAYWEQERLRSLLDSIPDEVWFCDDDGQISLINEAAVQEFGFTQAEDAHRPLTEVLLELDVYDSDGTPRPAEEAPLFRSLEGEVVEGEEELLLRETGEKRYRQVNSAPLRDPSGAITGSVAVIRDITELKRTEKKLRQRERDFTALANNIPQLVWMARPDGHIYWFNERWHEYTGTTFEEMKGWGWKKVHHPDHLDRVVDRYKDALESEKPFEETFPLRGKHGEYRWFLTRAIPIRNEKGRVERWFGTNTDITDRLRLEDQLKELNETLEERVEKRTRQVRELTSKVTMAEQRERERIARILYDGLQQKLYGIQLKMSSLRGTLRGGMPVEGGATKNTDGKTEPEMEKNRLIGQQEDALVKIEEMEDKLEKAIQSIRTLSVGMSPPVLDSDGLTGAFEWLQSHMEETRDLTVTLSAEREFRVDEEMRVLLFQIVRELLSNVADHAGIGHADVKLWEEEGHLLIRVLDQGSGFDPDNLDSLGPEEGFGLTAARQRIRLYGGDLTARSRPGEGTQVTVRVPLDRRPDASLDLFADGSPEEESSEKERGEGHTQGEA